MSRLGSRIQKLTDVKIDDPGTVRSLAEKTAMVRAARQLLSAITKVLILADRVVIKQLLTAKEKVLCSYGTTFGYNLLFENNCSLYTKKML